MRMPPGSSHPAASSTSRNLNPAANGSFAHRRRSLAAGFGPDVRSLGLAQQQTSYDEGKARDNHRVVESGIDIAGGGTEDRPISGVIRTGRNAKRIVRLRYEVATRATSS